MPRDVPSRGIAAAHPPLEGLEGEDRFACSETESEPRWGDSLSPQAILMWTDQPAAPRMADP
ncbi:protein of unknown function [Bradyrhizobium vignae]|uniref:Uncharacterized protein n=1 Tax=Bradyrhizobium vignae TaxID=1549949 RepID=A0A2U3PTB7_9BRAD|nr:protein of unknown function [Bradyrhizobium vignae]